MIKFSLVPHAIDQLPRTSPFIEYAICSTRISDGVLMVIGGFQRHSNRIDRVMNA